MVKNSLPLRLRIEPTTPTRELPRQTFQQTRDLVRHQRYRNIVEDLGVDEEAGLQQCGLEINYMAFDYDLRFGDAVGVVHDLARLGVKFGAHDCSR